jgi:ethanolamine ammonia-lyase large subunit
MPKHASEMHQLEGDRGITPEMIEAGSEILSGYDPIYDRLDVTIRKILRAVFGMPDRLALKGQCVLGEVPASAIEAGFSVLKHGYDPDASASDRRGVVRDIYLAMRKAELEDSGD